MAVDPCALCLDFKEDKYYVLDETHKILSEVGIYWTHKQKGLTASKQQSGDTDVLTFSCAL